MDYEEILAQSPRGERNDCTVISTAAAFCIDYEAAREIMSKACGRVTGHGSDYHAWAAFWKTMANITDGRACMAPAEASRALGGKTVMTAERNAPRGYIAVCYTYAHALTIVDGKAIDHSSGGRRRIRNAFLLPRGRINEALEYTIDRYL